MIDPSSPTNYHRSRPELEEWALFATMVPTKPAHRMALTLENMLANGRLVYGTELSPFDLVRIWIRGGLLGQVLRRHNVGQYTRLEHCWEELTRIVPIQRDTEDGPHVKRTYEVNLKSIQVLESIYGIGPKTAQFIVLHSVEGAIGIPIDTHWIKELRERGYDIRTVRKQNRRGQWVTVVPIDNARHALYEKFALIEVQKSGLTCAEKDLQVWRKWNQLGRSSNAA